MMTEEAAQVEQVNRGTGLTRMCLRWVLGFRVTGLTRMCLRCGSLHRWNRKR